MCGGRDGWILSKGGNRVLIAVSEPSERSYDPDRRRKALDESPVRTRQEKWTSSRKAHVCRDLVMKPGLGSL